MVTLFFSRFFIGLLILVLYFFFSLIMNSPFLSLKKKKKENNGGYNLQLAIISIHDYFFLHMEHNAYVLSRAGCSYILITP